MKTTLYAAYGSNMNIEQMAFRCPRAKVVGTSKVEDYELLFRGWKSSAVATIEPKEGCSVPLIVWEITKPDEDALDRYEGWPNFYRKQIFTIDFKGKPTEVMIYIMNDGYPIGIPSPTYFSTIRQGYKSAKFSLKILNKFLENSENRMP